MKLILFCLLFLTISVYSQDTTNSQPAQRYSMYNITNASLRDSIRKQLDTARAKVGIASRSGFINLAGTILADTFSVTGINNGAVTLNMSSWLSANGFSGMRLLGAMPYENPSNLGTAPIISLTTWTPSTASFQIRQQNQTTVTILTLPVLSGLPFIGTPNPTTIKLYISFVAY